jgi:16S rRNA (cytidine1402-2'-O)-methyltransferase
MHKGTLYLLPTFLAPTNPNSVFPSENLVITNTLNTFIVEDIRTARRFLRKAGFTKDFNEMVFHILDKHTDKMLVNSYLDAANKGEDIGLLSEAGVPCVADPGSEIVRIAHRQNIRVVPLTGPSSLLLALMASGFNGQNFVFHGYLPIKPNERTHALQKLEKDIYSKNQTQIFIEAPYRNNHMLESICKNCKPETLLCLAVDVTSEKESIKTMSVREWKKSLPDLHKKPVVFLLYH